MDASQQKHQKRHNGIVLFEQPELHLHPAFQVKLEKAIIHAVRESGYRFSIVLETHGKTFVEAMGISVYRGELQSEDVQVFIFNKDETNGFKITVTQFDEDGILPH